MNDDDLQFALEEIAEAEFVVEDLHRQWRQFPTKVNRSLYIDAVRQLKALREDTVQNLFTEEK